MTDKFKPPSSPDSPYFGAISRQSSIQPFAARHSRRHHPEATAHVSNLGHIAKILAILAPNTSKVSNLAPEETSPLSSPSKNTPTKLRRFLEHAEKDLGVAGATFFHYSMEDKGYGPDILHEVPDSDLKGIGIKPGDVLRLKRDAPLWFNGPDAKRRRLVSGSTSRARDDSVPATRTRFEKQWSDGGRASSFGDSMRPLGPDEERDCSFDWYYFSELTKSMIPVPPGYVPVLASEADENDDPSSAPFV